MFETPSSTSEITLNPKNFSGSDAPSDSSGLTITCHQLNGNNFLEWSQSVKIFLLGRERLGYVTGEIKKPAVTDTGFAKWIRDNGQYDWADPRDVALYQQIVTQRRLFQFLQGLNKDLDEVRGRVLTISPLPSLRKAFFMVKKEENRRCVMLPDEPYSTPERSALLIHQSSPSSKRRRPWCDHCKKPSHSKEKCWKLHVDS
ncbi:hypothetical protein J1N35_033822 [Gossypium stocksii]|uniref:Retrotransposon Copia-like N-terminal domain-containing protein n=1 Tax=Gossypium stocksii TaxID=47602 RepID=A0A9D3UQX3_9ROSI|nr:hypothetical protein J1N35_033822 [Gossypium stocksii]